MRKLIPLAAMVAVALIAFTGGSSPPASAGILPPGDLYGVDVNIFDDPAGHAEFIGMPDKIELQVIIDGLNIFIDGPEPWVPVSGGIKGDLIFTSGIGTVAGFPDIVVDFNGTLTTAGLGGLLTMGALGGLPTGQPIIYELKPQEPPPKSYTITVLKRNGDDLQGLPGWEINLYSGPGCSGDALDSGLTGADGLIEFGGLTGGSYSVEEKLQPDWNAEGPLCENTAVGLSGPVAHRTPTQAGALPVCPISPDLPFPDAGCDEFSSVATVRVELTDPEIEFDCDLSGPTQVTRSAVGGSPDAIQTEIVAMQLTGLCQPGDVTVTVTESPTEDSTGTITEQKNNTPGTMEFPADSFFDVFFEIETPVGTMHNNDPLTLSCKIDGIPPYGCFYEPDVGVVQLYDSSGTKVGTLIHAAHIPIDPKKKLVIFTNTPKIKLYTITVLKRHGETKQGLPDWEINLYDSPDCTGPVLSSGFTGADGLIEFGGLAPGSYSVEEKLQPGWNPEGPLCKGATVGLIVPLAQESPGPSGVVLICPISPNLPFPDPGCDEFSSVATVKVELTNPPVGEFACDLSGPTMITRGPVESKPPDSIDTEIVAMQLEGSCQPGDIPVKVRVSGTQPSTGRIIEQNDSIPGTLEFPADSFFDVFFEIITPIGTLHNNDPLRLRCKIDDIPPYGCFYEPDVGEVQLYDDEEKKAGSLIHAAHIPIDPKKVLVVFVNVPKPPNVVGDVSCGGVVTIVDAQLIAQLIVGRIEALDCGKNADVNGSGGVTIVDAQIIAQFIVGRIPSLP